MSFELTLSTSTIEYHSSMWIESQHISSIVTWLGNGNELPLDQTKNKIINCEYVFKHYINAILIDFPKGSTK